MIKQWILLLFSSEIFNKCLKLISMVLLFIEKSGKKYCQGSRINASMTDKKGVTIRNVTLS